MKLIQDKISINELKTMATGFFGNLVKAVVDVERRIMVVDAELHSDEEAFLVDNGSNQEDLWGINIYPEIDGDDFIEFDSMINLRPSFGNSTRGVDSPEIQAKIREILETLVLK
jgi:hypothetical protein